MIAGVLAAVRYTSSRPLTLLAPRLMLLASCALPTAPSAIFALVTAPAASCAVSTAPSAIFPLVTALAASLSVVTAPPASCAVSTAPFVSATLAAKIA